MSQAPFKSSVSDYAALRKRMEELGFIQPKPPEPDLGVDVSPKPSIVDGAEPMYPVY